MPYLKSVVVIISLIVWTLEAALSLRIYARKHLYMMFPVEICYIHALGSYVLVRTNAPPQFYSPTTRKLFLLNSILVDVNPPFVF